jgi:hypothetical protein
MSDSSTPDAVLLTGTKKNAGDFFISEAARKLFQRYSPYSRLVELPSWEPLGEHIERVNTAKALILCGGPALQPSLGRTIYPIGAELDRVKVPLIGFGLGWKGVPGDDYDVRHTQFHPEADPILNRLESDHPWIGCRDFLTCEMMGHQGIDSTLMTGCPAWYDPDYFEARPDLPSVVRSIVYTPAEKPPYYDQSVEVMRRLREHLFPEARMVVSFHRGWTADEHTPEENAANARSIKAAAENMGAEILDASGSADSIHAYKNYDLHVGYRVHAHFRFVSYKKPSYLIAEDGRGRGALEAMQGTGVLGWESSGAHRLVSAWVDNPDVLRVVRRRFGALAVRGGAPEEMESLVRDELSSGFSRFRITLDTVRGHWDTMKRMLESFPT